MSEAATTVARVLTEVEATLITDELKGAGIEATMSGAITGSMRMEAPSYIRVLVHEDDLAKAREVIEQFREDSSKIDWSQVDVGEFED